MVVEHIFFITAFCVGGLLFFFFFKFIRSCSVNFFRVDPCKVGKIKVNKTSCGQWPSGVVETGRRKTRGLSSEAFIKGFPQKGYFKLKKFFARQKG